MADDDPRQELGWLARLVIACAIVLILIGVLWYGVAAATWQRFWHDLIERPDAPMRFRFVLQPVMAAIAAIQGGLKDARAGRPPYFWTMLRKPEKRVGRLNEGLNATARIIVLAFAMDVIYQLLVLKVFYPNEAVVVALLLAFVPYVILRGLVVRAWHVRAAAGRLW